MKAQIKISFVSKPFRRKNSIKKKEEKIQREKEREIFELL